MNGELIFYLANKTHLCEKALEGALGNTGIMLRKSRYATTPEKLGELIIDAFENANIVFTAGGLKFSDENGIESVLSRALAGKDFDDLKKLKNSVSSEDGYLVRVGGQLLVALPDEPEEIDALLSGELRGYLERFTQL